MNVTAKQLDLLHHTLGLTPEHRTPYRNHYVAGDGHHSMPELTALEAMGLMVRRAAPAFCDPGDIVFYATDTGRAFALDNLAHPPKRSRYGEYLDAEYSESFAEWLCIEVPEIQSSDYRNYFGVPPGHYRYRRREFTRGERWSPEIVGEWKPTKKEAKTSYKEKLAQRRARPVAKETA